jgi:pectate lyase
MSIRIDIIKKVVWIFIGILLISGCKQIPLVVAEPTSTFAIPTPEPTMVSKLFPAFPGAEGFGADTIGGRFGRVIEVTNLNDSGEGSLRAALETMGPRIIVFRTGGTINLEEPVSITNPFVTLAGQTAPGSGITLRGEGITVATHDVIIRGMRVRIGDNGSPANNRDGINISTTFSDGDVYNVIIDHCSVSWAIDENISTWITGNEPFTLYNITVQWTISSEGLYNSIHVDEGVTNGKTDPHSMGMVIGKNGFNVSIHHNLFAHNDDRNPLITGVTNIEIVNNLIYAWGSGPIKFSSDKNVAHVFNNYLKAQDYSRTDDVMLPDEQIPGSAFFLIGNITDIPKSKSDYIDSRILNRAGISLSTNPLFPPSALNVDDTLDVYDLVLANAGAVSPARDPIDERIIRQVRERTGDIIDSQEEVGGWVRMDAGNPPLDSDHDGMPDNWEIGNGLDPANPNDCREIAASGYTWIEEYINGLIPMPE